MPSDYQQKPCQIKGRGSILLIVCFYIIYICPASNYPDKVLWYLITIRGIFLPEKGGL